MLDFKNRKTVLGVRRLLKGRERNVRPVRTSAGQEYEKLAGDDDVEAMVHGQVPKFRNSTLISSSSSSPISLTSSDAVDAITTAAAVSTFDAGTAAKTNVAARKAVGSICRRKFNRSESYRERRRRRRKKTTGSNSDASTATGMRLVEANDPVWYIVGQKLLSNYFESKFQNVDHLYADRSAYGRESSVREFVTDFRTVRVLVGRTGPGKTEYALAHFRQPLHIRDDKDWRRLSRSTDGIVLDDLDFGKWSPATFLKLLDISKPVTQNIKNGCVRIPARTPRFILVNSLDLLWPVRMPAATKMACDRRMTIEPLDNPLFDVMAIRARARNGSFRSRLPR
ncbi:hypothetical protein Trydic_g18677 [Trypoxylus dichotomus]